MDWKRMRRLTVVAAALTVAVAVQGCAKLPKNAEQTLQASRSGVTVLVDSSLTAPQHGNRPWISVPDNGSIAVEVDKAAEAVLGMKGYKIDQPVLVSVGARFDADAKLRVQKASQEVQTPEDISKPFVVWPGVSGEPMKVKINEVFAWSNRGKGDPRGSLDIFPSGGVILLSCWGDMSDWSGNVLLMVLDRASGKVVWLDKGSASAKSPEAYAKEVRRMLGELPAVH